MSSAGGAGRGDDVECVAELVFGRGGVSEMDEIVFFGFEFGECVTVGKWLKG